MKKLIIIFTILGLSLVLFSSFSWAHWVIEGEGKWQGELYRFSWEKREKNGPLVTGRRKKHPPGRSRSC